MSNCTYGTRNENLLYHCSFISGNETILHMNFMIELHGSIVPLPMQNSYVNKKCDQLPPTKKFSQKYKKTK